MVDNAIFRSGLLRLLGLWMILAPPWACSTDVGAPGTWLGPCIPPYGSCNEGLICYNEYCMKPGQVPDGGSDADGGPIADGGAAADGGADGGAAADGGAGADSGLAEDGGVVPDGGSDADGGPIADGGAGADGGVAADGGQGPPPEFLKGKITPYEPRYIYVTFDRPLSDVIGSGSAGFSVDGAPPYLVESVAAGSSAETLRLTLDKDVAHGGAISLSYMPGAIRSRENVPLGAFSGKPVSNLTPPPGKLLRISAGANHSCGLTATGEAYCWGADSEGQLGNDAIMEDSATPLKVALSHLEPMKLHAIALGDSHSCALTAAGKALCWGRNREGQLGHGLTMNESPLAVMVNMASMDERRFKSLTAGTFHTCGLTAQGRAYCWGGGDKGQLGDGLSSAISLNPVAVDVTSLGEDRFIALAAGGEHTCGLTGSGTAYCWGLDTQGQLGNDVDRIDKPSPVPVDMTVLNGEHFIALAAGKFHTCGQTATGKVFCWGADGKGQLGDDAAILDKRTPVPVDAAGAGNGVFLSLSLGDNHSCGVMASGGVYCWGADGQGQLGNGTGTTDQPLPVAVQPPDLPGEGFYRLAAGGNHSCAITNSGRAYCWGRDDEGQLGDGLPKAGTSVPAAVDAGAFPGDRFMQLEPGYTHACAVKASGAAFCWGADTHGQLGNGPLASGQPIPLPVALGRLNGEAFLSLAAGRSHSCGHTLGGEGLLLRAGRSGAAGKWRTPAGPLCSRGGEGQ